MAIPCAAPPPIHGFRVVAAGERFARVQWGHRKPWQTYQPFHYEIDWWSRDTRTNFLPTRLVLQAPTRSAILSNLDSKSNYSARILARSECGAAGMPIELNFATKSQEIHSAITRVMPHEVILITVVLLIWLGILYHFFKKYEKMTFVNPNRAFQEKQYEKVSGGHRDR
ncbi:unnamed protein product [Bursaphelenchus okinawaensis]|uniref:Fibronectin type-III domain-containing protein n=1 Tax=Bursaphelenchus okinawaensis TaxID=465554 RepID=A0A811K9Y4_9BILA|nr:unnamed protein product [Bursaphelenchus okinawaensis]CAG9096647.1 unnamed protein product [Bursaphelenchus okinawaensis]